MHSKDYYQILGVSYTASAKEIKSSFRKLALKYHPDKAGANTLAEAKFKEIKEAYTVLTDARKKREFDLENGAYYKNQTERNVTPKTILQALQQLNARLEKTDQLRINKDVLYQKVQAHLSGYNLVVLKEQDDLLINRKILHEVLSVCRLLTYAQVQPIIASMRTIVLWEGEMQTMLDTFLINKKRNSVWEKYKLVCAIVIALLLCYAVYRSAA